MGLMIAACMINFPLGEEWPTAEMSNRATWSNFFCGIPIAFFSGLGVAVGLLDSETNSLVGVAISASLLPPAVNAGMLWVLNRDEETQDRRWYNSAIFNSYEYRSDYSRVYVYVSIKGDTPYRKKYLLDRSWCSAKNLSQRCDPSKDPRSPR